MGTHKNEYILQEDESILNWQGQQDGSKESSGKEVSWVHDSPSATLVNLEQECIEALLGLLKRQNLKSSVDVSNEEHWDDNCKNEYNITCEQGCFPESS